MPSYPDPMPRDRYDEAIRRRQPRTMNDRLRAETILKLRRQGWTWEKVGRAVGLSANGAKYCLHRVTQPGQYTEVCEEEVDHGEAPEAW